MTAVICSLTDGQGHPCKHRMKAEGILYSYNGVCTKGAIALSGQQQCSDTFLLKLNCYEPDTYEKEEIDRALEEMLSKQQAKL